MLQNNSDLLEQQLRILSEARLSQISERDAYGLISLAKTREMMATSKELNNKVFVFAGTWQEFLTAIEKAGVPLDKHYYPYQLEGLECVECADWHYVLIGTSQAIHQFIKEREELFEIPVTTIPKVSSDWFGSGKISGSGTW
jgi:hypothetical protein